MSSEETAQVAESTEVEEAEAAAETEQSSEPESKEEESKEEKATLPDDPEILRKEIAKLRKENAAKRAKNKEIEEAAKNWQQHVDSQKSELEKLQDLAAKLQEENSAYKLRETQSKLAKEYDLDPDLAEFITGADLDEMTEKAKKLAAKANAAKKKTTANDLRAGRKSEQAEMTGSKWLKELFKD